MIGMRIGNLAAIRIYPLIELRPIRGNQNKPFARIALLDSKNAQQSVGIVGHAAEAEHPLGRVRNDTTPEQYVRRSRY